MGVVGLYAYLNAHRPQAHDAVRVVGGVVGAAESPRRVAVIDGNGLYHHLLFTWCAGAPRSCGGEWPRFFKAIRRFFDALARCHIRACVVMDGCTSPREAKSGTREHRRRERVRRMRLFAARAYADADTTTTTTSSDAPCVGSGCARVQSAYEALLPVAANSLLAFVQALAAIGVPVWHSDGENDEHLAALAWTLQHQQEGSDDSPQRPIIVDVMGQDSDFLIFDMATHDPQQQLQRNNNAGGCLETGGYVPFDSLRFEAGDQDSAPSISFRRYTAASVRAALGLPACAMPSLACLIGNDSPLELAHLHTYLRSPHFTRQAALAKVMYAGAKSARNNNATCASAGDANGGFATGSQLVEAVLAYVHLLLKTHPQLPKATSLANPQLYSTAMRDLVGRILGPDSQVIASAPSSLSSLSTAASSLPPNLSSLQAFHAAQLKYSLARFFQSFRVPHQVDSHLGVFDAGFHVETACSQELHGRPSESALADDNPLIDSPNGVRTAILLPTNLLALYRSAQLSPMLLSIVLTRQYQSHVSLGDVLHPCSVHSQLDGVCRRPATEIRPLCCTVDECGSGLRRRVYGLLMHEMDVRPTALPVRPRAHHADSMSTVTTLFSNLARSVTSLLGSKPPPHTSARSGSALPPLHATPSIRIRECIHIAPPADDGGSSDDDDDDEDADVRTEWRDVSVDASSPFAIIGTSESTFVAEWPSLFPESSGTQATAEWLDLFAVMDVSPDLGSFVTNRIDSLAQRQRSLVDSFSPLRSLTASAVPLALVFRNVLLQSLRGPLTSRFESAAIGCQLDAAVRAQLDRAILGVNALIAAFAITYCRGIDELQEDAANGVGADHAAPTVHSSSAASLSSPSPSPSSSPAAPTPAVAYLSIEAASLAHLFGDAYQWCVYALQALRCRSLLRASNAESNHAAASPPAATSIVPLFLAFNGSLFHLLYARALGALESSRLSKSTSKTTKKTKQSIKRTDVSPPLVVSTSAASTSTSSSSSAASSSSVFSLALRNALNEVDSAVQPFVLDLLTAEVVVPAEHAQSLHLYHVVKTAVWRSVGLTITATEEKLGSNAAVSIRPIPLAPYVAPRSTLPYEICISEGDSASPSRPLPSSRHFSLCCAADSIAPVCRTASDPPPQQCAQCTWRAWDFEPEQSGSEDSEDDQPAATSKKGKRGKKKAKGGKR